MPKSYSYYLKVYVDVFGRIGFCEKFPDDEEHAGFDSMLEELASDQSLWEEFDESPGFYKAELILEYDNPTPYTGGFEESWLEIKELTALEEEDE